MTLIVFLYITAISLIFAGVEIILIKKEIKISDRLATFIFFGSIPAAIKALTTKPIYYLVTGKYKNLLGVFFFILGLTIYFVALSNSKYFGNY